MQLLIWIAVLAAFWSHRMPAEPTGATLPRLLLAVFGAVIVVLLAFAISRVTVAALVSDFQRRREVLRRFSRLRWLHAVVWLSAAGMILYVARIVRTDWQLGSLFLVDDLLILGAVLGPLILSWAHFYDVDLTLRRCLSERLGLHSDAISRQRYVGLHVRQQLFLVLLPVVTVCAIDDALQIWFPAMLENHQVWMVYVLAMVCMLLALPWLLRFAWQARPLADGSLRSRLRRVDQSVGLRPREILVWNSGGTVLSAATSNQRHVFLSDGLVAQLPEDEVVAIYAHELGHLRHRHHWRRVFAAATPLLIGKALTIAIPELQTWSWIVQPAVPLPGVSVQPLLILLGIISMAIFVGYARLQELQADLYGAADWEVSSGNEPRITPQSAERFVCALERLAGDAPLALRIVHPSARQRIAFVRRMVASPRGGVTFCRGMQAIFWIICAPLVLAVYLVVLQATFVSL